MPNILAYKYFDIIAVALLDLSSYKWQVMHMTVLGQDILPDGSFALAQWT